MHGHLKKPALTKFYSLFKLTALCAFFHEAAAQPPLTTAANIKWGECALATAANIKWGGCGAGKCDLCEGDCDYDSDCKAGLRCFQRDGLAPVPGCSGDGLGGWDYCIPSALVG